MKMKLLTGSEPGPSAEQFPGLPDLPFDRLERAAAVGFLGVDAG